MQQQWTGWVNAGIPVHFKVSSFYMTDTTVRAGI